MKVFITNQYGNIINQDISSRQWAYAKNGHELGFYEIGLFVFDVSSDNDIELSKRLDGIIASIEKDDMVIVQLPTGNGQRFEVNLFCKIVAYSGRKPLALWQSAEYYNEKHDEYLDYLFDEIRPMTNFKNDILGIEKKKILIDFVSENMQKDFKESEESENAIHIGFGLHDKTGDYSVWVGTVMQSIIEHTDAEIVFHILHDDTLSDLNSKKLRSVAERGGDKIQFHFFDSSIFGDLNDTIGRYTIGTMFRIMLPEVLPNLERIIYLDADLFVNRDIRELWNIDISKFCLAAVPDSPTVRNCATPYPVAYTQVERQQYFNAGVLYFNLTNMRKKGNTRELILTYLQENPKASLFDQDALNAIYTNDSLLLDASWNYFIDEVRRVKNTGLEKKIYHYAATKLVLYFKNDVDIAYYQTILRTPWGQIEGERQLSRSLIKMNDRIEQLELLIENMTNKNKKAIFYGNSVSMSTVMKMLHIGKESCIYVEEMNEEKLSKHKDDFFIVSAEADNGKGIEKLEKNGLINGKNFVVTQRLVGPYEGGFLF